MKNKNYISHYDSENTISQKFILIGMIAKKGNLSKILENLLSLAKEEFNLKTSEYSVVDLIDPTKGTNIFDIYQDFFTINEVIDVDWNLTVITHNTHLNIDWIESKKEYLFAKYPNDFLESSFDEEDTDLLKECFIISILDKNILSYNREYLGDLFPDYFTSSRKGKFYQNKKTRKLLSMVLYFDLLTPSDKKEILSDFILRMNESLDDRVGFNSNHFFWRLEDALQSALKILDEELELLS